MHLRFFKAVFQEIMVEHFRDFHQLGHVDALSFEHLINIRLLTRPCRVNSSWIRLPMCTSFILNSIILLLLKKLCKCRMMEKKARKQQK